MVTPDDVQQLLTLGHEIRSFEVKGPGDLDNKAYCAKVARAAIALGNLRDGGLICIGIDDKRMVDMLPGLSATQLSGWSDFDNVNDALARYADPPVAFHLYPIQLVNGIDVVAIEVAEFEDIPHLCRRDYQDILQKGMMYVRPRGKPESVPVPSPTEMREVLDLAITKGVREFIRRAGVAGVHLTAGTEENEREQFLKEAERAWADPTAVAEQVLLLGHTDVAIQPGPYMRNRVSPANLEEYVLQNVVRLRGWPVPFVETRTPIVRHGEWIGQDIGPGGVPHLESWRACTSGQFLHRRALATDLEESPYLKPHVPNASGAVAVWDVLLYSVEVAEFAARIGTRLECETVTISVALAQIGGRQLISGSPDRELNDNYVVNARTLEAIETLETARLIENPRRVGVQITQQLLRQFGANISDQVLSDWQDQVFGNR
ncbi:helix-turn-helix domain-containing protein [Micromonospora sp. AB353]|uniref:AlbA family DNA-binding domain-containing protein n=1 Tax=Micromonospora sp. AB353 TaxID=3413282 RepID=UPI003C299B06